VHQKGGLSILGPSILEKIGLVVNIFPLHSQYIKTLRSLLFRERQMFLFYRTFEKQNVKILWHSRTTHRTWHIFTTFFL